MPLYDYQCTQCGKICEVRHGFGESHDEPCSACGAAMRRVFNPAPILFKGAGFYVTDSRKSAKSSDTSSSSSSGAEPKTAKPEAAPSAANATSDSKKTSDAADSAA